MTPAIRPATTADRPALIDLWVEAWRTAMPQIDFDARRTWFAGHLEQLCADGASILVAGEGEPEGFVTIDPAGTVDQLVVAVGAQRQGVAGALIIAARSRAPAGLRLSVNADNRGAVSFYKRQGFAVTGHGTNALSGLPVLHMAG